MKIFISWSGERSRAVAEALRDWLPSVIQALKPWISSEDIAKGKIWWLEIIQQLEEAQVGIVCLTRENFTAPWVLFEAGALAKSFGRILICPYLLDLKPSELTGPLTQFQATVANKPDTLRLLHTINNELKAAALPKERLNRTFERWWPELEKSLDNIPKPHLDEMREKAQEFKAYEIVEGKKRDLPLLPEPIYNYTDAEGNFDYGTVFAFALGQNPEVFITFEKYPEGISCELARIGGAGEMYVLWNGRHIWWSDLVGGRDPEFFRSYTNFKYTDLKDGKLFAPEPEIIRIDDKPLLIDTCEARIKIEPDFLDWEAFSMLFWVRITQNFINTQNNRYLFSYTTDTTDTEDKEHYPNGFYFGIRESDPGYNWEFAVKGPDPQNKTLINFPPSEVSEDWSLFSIRWDRSSRKIKFDITSVNSNTRFKPKEDFVAIDSWPINVKGHFFVLGDWTQHDPNGISGISSLEFYKFRLFKEPLSDSEVRFIFGTERASVQEL
jgi:hypothetical protein